MTGKPGRPYVGERVGILIPPDLLAKIDEAARRDYTSRAEWIRRACAEAVISQASRSYTGR